MAWDLGGWRRPAPRRKLSRWRGFTDYLQTPHDLLAKMEHDLARMKADPIEPYPAFDFFVAAEHMVDWRYPDDPAKQKETRSHDPCRTVSHLASGAKHFEATAPRHKSVRSVERVADHEAAVWGTSPWDDTSWDYLGRPALIVTMADGREVEAIQLAELVLAYWRTELGPRGLHEVEE